MLEFFFIIMYSISCISNLIIESLFPAFERLVCPPTFLIKKKNTNSTYFILNFYHVKLINKL